MYKNPDAQANSLIDDDLLIYGSKMPEKYYKDQWEKYKLDPNAYESQVNPDIYTVIRRYGKKIEPDHPIHQRDVLPF